MITDKVFNQLKAIQNILTENEFAKSYLGVFLCNICFVLKEDADLDTERKFDNEGHAAKHKTYVDTINEFQSAAQLKLLKENRKQGVQIIADSNKKFNELTSNCRSNTVLIIMAA